MSLNRPSVLPLTSPLIDLDTALIAAEQIVSRISTLSEMVTSDNSNQIFYRRVRSKNLSSILEKEKRKRDEGKIYYSFRDMTDLVGFRLVTLYPSSLLDLIEHVLSMARTGKIMDNPIFQGATILECINNCVFYDGKSEFYKDSYKHFIDQVRKDYRQIKFNADKEKGPQNSNLNNLIKRKIKKDQNRDENYSSVHVIFNSIAYINGQEICIPTEFQIRTAFEDIWSEVNHKNLYKLNSGNAWTLEYEEALHDCEESSESLSKIINDGMKKSEELSLSASFARKNNNKLRGPRFVKSRESSDIKNISDASYIGYLFLQIGERDRSDFLSSYRNYSSSIKLLQKGNFEDNTTSENFSKAYASLILLKRTIQASIQKYEPVNSKGRHLEPRMKLLTQRLRLAELEIVRTEIAAFQKASLICVDNKFVEIPIDSNKKITTNESRMKILQKNLFSFENFEIKEGDEGSLIHETARSLYKRLCEILDASDLEVQPLIMATYWKAKLSEYFSRDISWVDIRHCMRIYTSDEDACLPKDSIYHGLVLGTYSAQLLDRATRTIRDIKGLDAERPVATNKSKRIIGQLIEAHKICCRAFSYSREYKSGQGDILYGYNKNQLYRDINTYLSIINVAAETFGPESTKNIYKTNPEVWKTILITCENVDHTDLRINRIPPEEFQEKLKLCKKILPSTIPSRKKT